MARQRRSSIESLVDAYIAMDPEERVLALAALRGADRALSTVAARNGSPKVTDAQQSAFAELGGNIVEEQDES